MFPSVHNNLQQKGGGEGKIKKEKEIEKGIFPYCLSRSGGGPKNHAQQRKRGKETERKRRRKEKKKQEDVLGLVKT